MAGRQLPLYLTFLVTAACAGCTVVDVIVYYEALCSDSNAFLRTQLAPNWAPFVYYLHLTLVPYGKANVSYDDDQQPSFTCQHGPVECEMNKAMACAMKLLNYDMNAAVPFILCAQGTNMTTVSFCGGKANINSTLFDRCQNGPEGTQLMLENANRTGNWVASGLFIPSIVMNGRLHEGRLPQFDFRSELCKLLSTNDLTHPCTWKNGASINTVSTLCLMFGLIFSYVLKR